MLKKNLAFVAKTAPALALAYCLCPVDAIPDFLPIIGQLDDLAVASILLLVGLIAASILFIAVKHEHFCTSAFLTSALIFCSMKPAIAAVDSPSNLSVTAASEKPPLFKLSLTEAFERAARYNKQLIANEENRAIAKANVTIAKAYPNPQFALQYGFGTPYTKIISGNTQQAGINQTIEFPAKTIARIQTAKAGRQLAEAQYVGTQFDTRIQVRRAYAELAAAEANIELVETQRDLTEKLYVIAKKKFQAGSSPGVDAMQAELALIQFDTQRVQAQARLSQASAQMDLLIGERPDRIIDVEDNGIFRLSAQKTSIVPEVQQSVCPFERLLTLAYGGRPDMRIAMQQVETNRKSLRFARAQQVPDLMLGSGYVFSTYLKDQDVPVQRGIYLNANMDMPIFYHHQGEVDLAKANYRQSIKQLEATKAQIATDIQTAYYAFIAARQNITNYQSAILPKAAEVTRLARRAYENGLQPISAVIVAQQQYQQTRSSYFDTVVAYQNAWADLEKSVGQPLDFIR